jgi:hypothetical protein
LDNTRQVDRKVLVGGGSSAEEDGITKKTTIKDKLAHQSICDELEGGKKIV